MKKYLYLFFLLLVIYFFTGLIFYQYRLSESLSIVSQDISYDVANQQIWNAEKRLKMIKQFGFDDLEIQYSNEYNFKDTSCLLKYSKPLIIDGIEVAKVVNCASVKNVIRFVIETQWLGIVFIVFFFIAFVSITYPLLAYKSKIQKFIKNYSAAENYSNLMNDSILSEILNIIQSNISYQKQISELQMQSERQNILHQLSKQVAHDIRSPLSALNMITSSLNEVPHEQRELIKNSIQRINDIANDLLKKGKNESFNTLLPLSKEIGLTKILLTPIVDSIISEKRFQFKGKSKIEISHLSTHSYFFFTSVNESELKRVLSNLINNSVEAIGKNLGFIQISLTSDAHNAIIKVTDNGPGIPPHILEKLGTESISYGKENTESGNGLGVLHAKKTIESMNGQFTIASTLGKGTEITITLPLAERPIWFLEKLYLKPNSTVLICDDDSSIIALWKKRLSEYQNISVNYFTSLNGLKDFLESAQPTEFTLLTDYEFSGEKQNGLDFILENQLASKAILVTSHYDEPDIIQKCTENGIKQIPKNICALVPIEMASSKEYFDAIVLDDEDLQVRSWQFAAIQKGKTIKIFSMADDFLSFLPNIDNKTPIFIDSILGQNIKGEDIAKQVYDLGFKNVYMSSGHDPSYFKDLTFLKGVIGKTPFFP